MSQLSKQALKVENQTSFPNNTTNYITPTILRDFNIDMIDSLVDENTYNADSQSWNQKINALDPSGSATSILALNQATASLFTSTSLSLTTASFNNGTRNLTFTKGNGTTFSVNIPDVSGSSGNFATTGSNTFNGNQTINGILYVSSSDGYLYTSGANGPVLEMGNGISVYDPNSNQGFINASTVNLGRLNGGGVYAGTAFGGFYGTVDVTTDPNNVFFGNLLNSDEVNNQTIGFAISAYNDPNGNVSYCWYGPGYGYNNNSSDNVVFQMYSGSNTLRIKRDTNLTGSFTVSGSLTLTGSANIQTLTASLQNGYTWVGNSAGKTTLVATSSFGTPINTASFATTGSNSFNGNQTITGSLTISSSNAIDATIQGQLFITGGRYNSPAAMKLIAQGYNSNGQDIERLTYDGYQLLLERSGSTGANNSIQLVSNGTVITADYNTNNFGYFSNNFIELDGGTGNIIGFTQDSTALGLPNWNGSAIYQFNSASQQNEAAIAFQDISNYTDGAVSVLFPLNVINNPVTLVQSGITLVGNLQFSGSQYPNIGLTIDATTAPADVYGGYNISRDYDGFGIIQFAANSYTPQYFGEVVGWLGGGGNNPGGDNTAIIFRTGSGNMEVFKPTIFNYPVTISSSVSSTNSFTQAQLTSNQTVNASADTTIIFNSNNVNNNGWYNTSTGVLTPTVAGTYEISFSLLVGIGTGNGQMNAQINFNNGTQKFITQDETNKNQPHTLQGSTIINFNGTTDNVKITFYNSSNSGNQVVQGGAGTQFRAILL